MRHPVAILAGAFVAALPIVFLAWPDYALRDACHRFEESSFWSVPVREAQNDATAVEAPCDVRWESFDPAFLQLLTLGAALACLLGGRLAAHISETQRVLVASAAGSLPYVVLGVTE